MSGFDLVAGLLGYKRRPEVKARPTVNGVQIPYAWPAWRAGQPDWTPATLQGYAEAGYEGNSLVLACIRRRAQSAAFAPLVAYMGERAQPERLPDAHPLAQLLRRPNPWQSWYEFAEQGITYLDLDGNLFIYMAWRSLLARRQPEEFPAALYLLRPDRVRVVPGRNRTEPLWGYVYDAEDTGAWLSREPFLPSEVIHVKYPNPRDPFEGFGRGTSPLGAAAKQVDVDNAATSFLKTFFAQGVVPYGLLKSKQTLVDDEVARIRDRLKAQYAGQQNWGEVMILDADAEYQQMGMSMRDMTFGDLDARNEARICQVLDVPPILVGAKVGLDQATYSNYEQARSAFWQDALIPGVYQRLEDALNLGLGTPEVWLAYDYSGVPALREDEVKQAETAVRLFLGGVARRNEARARMGLEPADEDGFRAADEQQIGAPAVTRTPVRVDGPDGSNGEDGEDEKSLPFIRDVRSGVLQHKAAAVDGANRERLNIEETWAPQIAEALSAQLRLALPKGTTAETVWQAVGRLDDGKQALSDVLYRMLREAANLGLAVADAQVSGTQRRKAAIEFDWTLVNSQVLEYLKTYLFELVGGLHANSVAAVRQAVSRWVENGLPLQDLVDELTPMFGPVRAEMIASTEVTRAFAMANLAYWKASGTVDKVSWRTANDERVCPICSALGGIVYGEDGAIPETIANQEENAVTVAVGEPFVHPGGPGKQGAYAGKRYEMPPAHVRCILPGNEVVIPGPLSAAAKSFYIGRCIEIGLADGRKLTVTENHPVLTLQGWVAAQFINAGDDVVCAADAEGIAASIQPDDDHRPTKIEELFGALMKLSTMETTRVPVTAVDFYSDGRSIHGDVDVVHVNGFLECSADPVLRQLRGENGFNIRDVRQSALFAPGLGDLLGIGYDAASRGLVGVGEHLRAFFGSGVVPSDEHRVGNVSGLDVGGQQASSERPAVDTGLLSESLLRFARQVAGKQGVEIRDFDTPGVTGAMPGVSGLVEVASDKSRTQGFVLDTTLARQFCQTFAGQIAATKVVKIRDFDFTGHVYDLQADMYELYICNGVVVKNCRCWLAPG